MATLTNQKIQDTYRGLIKLDDNGTIDPTVLKQLTDGTGGSLPIQVSQVQTKFQSLVDFTDATITGLDSAGLVAGTGTESMQSAATLTTNPATAIGFKSIALGDAARGGSFAGANHAIAIGTDADAESAQSVAIGFNTWAQSGDSIAIGTNAHARIGDCISIGRDSQAANISGIAIGYTAQTAIEGTEQIAIGLSARGNGTQAVAIGRTAIADAAGSVALGSGVTANIADTVSIKALEVQTDSTPTAGGIIMSGAGGTDRRINIDASGNLQIDSTPVGGGGGGAAGLVAGTGTDSMKSADSLTSTPAVASASNTIALGRNAVADTSDAIAIGYNSFSSDLYTIAIGTGAQATNDWTVALGKDAIAYSRYCMSIGANTISGVNGNSNKTYNLAVGWSASAIETQATALGYNSTASAAGATALGAGVTAAIADTASVKELEVQTVGGGIIMYSPNGTGYKLTVSDAGAPVFTAL